MLAKQRKLRHARLMFLNKLRHSEKFELLIIVNMGGLEIRKGDHVFMPWIVCFMLQWRRP